MKDFINFADWMAEHFEDENGQYELSRFRLALETRKRQTRNRDEVEFIDLLSGYIEDQNFWDAIGYLAHLQLPK